MTGTTRTGPGRRCCLLITLTQVEVRGHDGRADQIERARAQERGAKKATLSQRKCEDFVAMLAALTLDRASIRKIAMGFALDNTERGV